jgi:hypothetical protein
MILRNIFTMTVITNTFCILCNPNFHIKFKPLKMKILKGHAMGLTLGSNFYITADYKNPNNLHHKFI